VQYANRILSVSVPTVKFSVAGGKYVAFALVVAVVYSWFWALGVGGVAAAEDKRFDAIYVLLLLLSLAWTMQVLMPYANHGQTQPTSSGTILCLFVFEVF